MLVAKLATGNPVFWAQWAEGEIREQAAEEFAWQCMQRGVEIPPTAVKMVKIGPLGVR